jgi:hypothetical protein
MKMLALLTLLAVSACGCPYHVNKAGDVQCLCVSCGAGDW